MQNIVFEHTEDALKPLLDVINIKSLPLSNAILINIGRQGVMLAHTLAQKLKIPMEFLFTQTIASPLNPECPIAVVSEDMEMLINENLVNAFDISPDYVYNEAQRQYEEVILPSLYQFKKGEGLESLKGKDVLLFDIGIETGLRMGVAMKTCMNMKAKSLCVIAPVMPKSIYDFLCEICDDVCCPYPLENYVGTSHYFPHLNVLDDEAFEEALSQTTTQKDT